MPPRKRKSHAGPEEPPASPVTTTTLPEAYKAIAQPTHEALNTLLRGPAEDTSLEDLKETARSALVQHFPKDRETADSVLQSWLLTTSALITDDFALLYRALDIALCCTHLALCSDTFVVWSLETLFESLSVQKCSRLFDWVEKRSAEITMDLDPRRAKALTLLRTFNELLRRLSKANQTVFCGRILMFLAASFPLGDQSSVNLKGAFDTGNVTTLHEPDWGQAVASTSAEKQEDDQEKPAEQPQEPDFYTVFWSLQRIFSFPPNLLKPDALFPYNPSSAGTSDSSVPSATTTAVKPDGTLDTSKLPNLTFLRYAVERTLSTFQAANKKDKEMSGASASADLVSASKAKAEATSMDVDEEAEQEHIKQHYFFPKFLTSRGLLELQVADSNFRRQIIIQILVVFQYLRGYSKPEKERAAKITTPNRGLIPQVTIAEGEMSWIASLNQQCHIVIRESMPNGVAFDATLILVLQREQHWIRWKLASCQDFVKQPIDAEAASNEAREKKRRLQAPARPLQWKMGNPGLTQLWSTTGDDPLSLEDLRAPAKPVKSLDYFDAEIKKQLELQEERKAALTGDTEPTARQLADDPKWAACEDRKASLCWRALRLLAPNELANFSKINKQGSFTQLIDDIQNPKGEAEPAASDRKKAQPEVAMAVDTPTADPAEAKQEEPEEKPADQTATAATSPDKASNSDAPTLEQDKPTETVEESQGASDEAKSTEVDMAGT